ncbi:major facilitator superfamily domain-containing protein [Cantharellus anzutake]|uniref:major facilitator superfamily domain-containing protein n=1 Tax=Cantharellus anzutake TaxID=1750568 RepID=UPI0019065B14|nr:major facilitator superfamily domain-containing protein [Cantharellus anzutake]KAF8342993.1 major facilitator superfamily domain-containing protein [Cantharellus anzutake]
MSGPPSVVDGGSGWIGTSESNEEAAVALPAVDSGFHAWLFIFCSFVLETLEWYLTHPPFNKASQASINAIGTVVLAIQYSEGLLCVFLAQKYPGKVKLAMKISACVCMASMLLSSFATEVWQLIMLQGVVYGIAGGALYMPVLIWFPEWFVARRSLAGSLIFGGSGRTGFRWTVRIYGFIIGSLSTLALLGINLEFLAYLSVSLYIPSYASSLGYSRMAGTLSLSAFNMASVVGQILIGYHCDKRPYPGIMVITGLLSAGGFTSIWTPACSEVSSSQPSVPFMFFSAVKGVSAVCGPMIAAALHPIYLEPIASHSTKAWGGHGITIFVGSMMVATTIGGVLSAAIRG